MSLENKKEKLQIFYVKWDGTPPFTCSNCGSEIKFVYNNGGRYVTTLWGDIKLYINYYACQNESCTFSAPFHLPHDVVLPHKHFGLDVWRWVISSHVEFHDSPGSIASRLSTYYNLGMSPNTAKSIIETYLAANSLEADKESLQRVKASGKIYLALDGQKPNNGESGLWLFIDTITDRIVHMEYLKKASWKVLSGIFKKIEAKYGVKIRAVLSDHQSSIIKAVQETLPGIPHQFCHYHFIRNLHRTIEALDSHLHVELTKIINQIISGKSEIKDRMVSVNGFDVRVSDFIQPVLEDLSSYSARKSRAFDYFSGHALYKNLASYARTMDSLIARVKTDKRLRKMLVLVQEKIRGALALHGELFLKVQELIPLFNEIRAVLGHTPARQDEIRAGAECWNDKLLQELAAVKKSTRGKKLKYKQITFSSSLADVLEQWIRLYSTHKSGLFYYCNLQGLPRSNVALESLFSLESRHFRKTSGHAFVGNLIRVKGGEMCQVFLTYDRDSIHPVLVDSDRKLVAEKIKNFRSRQEKQSRSWHSKRRKKSKLSKLLKHLDRRAITIVKKT